MQEATLERMEYGARTSVGPETGQPTVLPILTALELSASLLLDLFGNDRVAAFPRYR